MLSDQNFAKTAVIVNEFGAVGIDHDLLGVGDDQIVLLSNGCVCCTARSGLENALLDIWRRNRAGDIEVDRIVIETSGIADPIWILQILAPGGRFGDKFSRRQLVVVVDAGAGVETLQSSKEARRQVAFADRIKISKLDVFPSKPELLNFVRKLNPDAVIDLQETGDMCADHLFRDADRPGSLLEAGPNEAQMSGRDEYHKGLRTVSIVEEEPVHPPVIALFLEGLSKHCGEKLLRVKGIVNVAGNPEHPLLVQGTSHQRAEVTRLSAWPSSDRRSRISIIANDIPEQWPELLFRMLRLEVGQVLEPECCL